MGHNRAGERYKKKKKRARRVEVRHRSDFAELNETVASLWLGNTLFYDQELTTIYKTPEIGAVEFKLPHEMRFAEALDYISKISTGVK